MSQTYRGVCTDFTDMMIRCADKVGATGEFTFAGYKNHYYATITFPDGTTKIYDAPIGSSTNRPTEWEMMIP